MANVRAKLKVTSITEHAGWAGSKGPKEIKLTAQYDQSIPEDQRFQDATPSGELRMVVNNPAALEQLQLGRDFYLDLVPVE